MLVIARVLYTCFLIITKFVFAGTVYPASASCYPSGPYEYNDKNGNTISLPRAIVVDKYHVYVTSYEAMVYDGIIKLPLNKMGYGESGHDDYLGSWHYKLNKGCIRAKII